MPSFIQSKVDWGLKFGKVSRDIDHVHYALVSLVILRLILDTAYSAPNLTLLDLADPEV